MVCGGQDGVLWIFSYGRWGDISNRFPGHPKSIDTIVSYDDSRIITGSSDGILRWDLCNLTLLDI